MNSECGMRNAEFENCQPKDSDKFENCQPEPVRCGCGSEAVVDYLIGEPSEGNSYCVYCKVCEIHTGYYDTEAEAIQAWNLAMGAKDINVPDKERTAKATRKPEAFFYRCECGYGLCCEKNDMNYCPNCGGRLEWE